MAIVASSSDGGDISSAEGQAYSGSARRAGRSSSVREAVARASEGKKLSTQDAAEPEAPEPEAAEPELGVYDRPGARGSAEKEGTLMEWALCGGVTERGSGTG